MKAWYLESIYDLENDSAPLRMTEAATPSPGPHEILLRVLCCGVCHTELDEIEGRTPPPSYPIIPGHQVVGEVEDLGVGAHRFRQGDRVGVAWIGGACGTCDYCRAGQENLCESFCATGRDINGGYATHMVVDENFAYRIPDVFSNVEAAPLLCAGAIGYRSLMLAGLSDGMSLGLTGFGASGHLVLKMAQYLYPRSEVFVFARSADEQGFARQLGAVWAGPPDINAPALLHAVIDTTPAWRPVVGALLCLKPGGRLVINAIRKESNDLSALQTIRYPDHLWMEKEIKTVANITRKDVDSFLSIAAQVPIIASTQVYPFDRANEALIDLKRKHVNGAKVLVMQ